jgi:hypothetical protein
VLAQSTGPAVNKNVTQTVTVSCPAGKTAFSGSWETTAVDNIHIQKTAALSDGSGWEVRWRQNDVNGRTITVHAVCATAS